MKDEHQVREEVVQAIRDKPEDQRTGEESAILGIDNAVEAAKNAFEKAGFELDHLILIYDADVSPDKNPEAAMAGMVIVPDHQPCAVNLLASTLSSVAEAGGMVKINLGDLLRQGGGQSGPIHHQS